MGGDHDGIGRDVEDDPTQLLHRETEGGTPIGKEVSAAAESCVQSLHCLQRRGIQKGMDLSETLPLLVNIADLHLEDKANTLLSVL